MRWSHQEAVKPYARPFGVIFRDPKGVAVGGVAVNGPDLLYYRQFQAAVLDLTGELFLDEAVESAPDPQAAWLEEISALLPPVEECTIRVLSNFDDDNGRTYRFAVGEDSGGLNARQLLEYQEFQAVVAHKTGALYRNSSVEKIADFNQRQTAWVAELGRLLHRTAP